MRHGTEQTGSDSLAWYVVAGRACAHMPWLMLLVPSLLQYPQRLLFLPKSSSTHSSASSMLLNCI